MENNKKEEVLQQDVQVVDKKEKKKESKKDKIINIVFTVLQVVMILVCVIFSITMISSSNNYRFTEAQDVKADGLMIVVTDSMEPTFEMKSLISGKAVSEDVVKGETILDLTTRVTFAKKMYSADGSYYIPVTHRIIGYGYKISGEDAVRKYFYHGEKEYAKVSTSNWQFQYYITAGDKYLIEAHNYGDYTVINNADGTSGHDGKQLYRIEANGDLAALNYQTIDDLHDDYRVYGYDMQEIDGQQYAIVNDSEIMDFKGYEITYASNIVGVVKSEKGSNFIGNILYWLREPSWHFVVVIIVPLLLLFGYNVYLIIRMIIEDKQKKAREEAKQEVLADQEEIKRKAIEEYLASLKEKENSESENN